ncbi:MAG TPA: DUF262 domain-containing protein [Bryobacteraceae bacterium]|jgi:hypothetical protein|nr:DUF262 domain-containing protein [Bryobacteraceae bacterium]
MPTHKVNLDALIKREDFETGGAESVAGREPIFKVEELSHDRMYFSVLRKPDFQRPTNNWTPEMIVDLVKSWLDGELVPALILWHSKQSGKVFIVDGAHRLSALIGWVNDDYGDGPISHAFFDEIPMVQVKFHKQTQELMAQRVGGYKELHRMAMKPLPTDDPEKVRRGRAIATLQPAIQKVDGEAQTAESSFLKINANPATIDPTDLDLIRARKKPNAVATRALMRAGTDYFAKLKKVKEIDALAKEVHGIVFGQVLELTSQSPDVPRAGQPYSSEAFKMVLDMVNMFNGVTPAMWEGRNAKKKSQVPQLQDDVDGSVALQYLKKVKNVGTLVNDNGERNSGSLGLDQAVYSYGATGKFHPGAFLAALRFAKELEADKKLKEFTKVRKDFEEFLVRHKIFINQIGHSKGSRTRPVESMLQMHRIVLDCMVNGIRDDKAIVRKLKRDDKLEGLKDVTNIPKDDTKRKKFSKEVQAAAVLRSVLDNRERCKICVARLPPSCRSKDHKQRAVEQGVGTLENLQFTHPYCNTGYKESQKPKQAKKSK